MMIHKMAVSTNQRPIIEQSSGVYGYTSVIFKMWVLSSQLFDTFR